MISDEKLLPAARDAMHEAGKALRQAREQVGVAANQFDRGIGLWDSIGGNLGKHPGCGARYRDLAKAIAAAELRSSQPSGRAPRSPPQCRPDRRNAGGQGAVAAGMSAPFDPYELLATGRIGILATIKADGRPQLSPITPFYDRDAGVVLVSMTEGRAKTRNLRRDPRATMEVTSADGWSWATAEGVATIIGPGTDPDGPEVDALVDYYRRAAGGHPDWAEYRAVMVADRRVLMSMTVDRVYGERIR